MVNPGYEAVSNLHNPGNAGRAGAAFVYIKHATAGDRYEVWLHTVGTLQENDVFVGAPDPPIEGIKAYFTDDGR